MTGINKIESYSPSSWAPSIIHWIEEKVIQATRSLLSLISRVSTAVRSFFTISFESPQEKQVFLIYYYTHLRILSSNLLNDDQTTPTPLLIQCTNEAQLSQILYIHNEMNKMYLEKFPSPTPLLSSQLENVLNTQLATLQNLRG